MPVYEARAIRDGVEIPIHCLSLSLEKAGGAPNLHYQGSLFVLLLTKWLECVVANTCQSGLVESFMISLHNRCC